MLLPLSETIILGVPLRATNLKKQLAKVSAEQSCAISRCTALVAPQVKRITHLLCTSLHCLTLNGPAMSTPQNEKGESIVSFSFSICGERGMLYFLPLSNLQTLQDLTIFFTVVVNFGIL